MSKEMETKELIQELVWLCVERSISFQHNGEFDEFCVFDNWIAIDSKDANQQLQNAIEQVREL